MMKINVDKKRDFWIIYTFLFALIAGVIFLPFFLRGNSFVRSGDGFNQTYPVLIYIGRYIREWINSGFKLKQFDFSLGLGDGVVSALSWLGFGDVFTIAAALAKPEWTVWIFNCIVLLKFYASGITFSIYCRHHKIAGRYILLSVFFYVFNRFSLVAGIEFYQNLNPVVWLPLLLLGIDQLIERKKISPLFIVTIFIQGLNGFYYLYIETLLGAVYFIVRYIGEDQKRTFKDFTGKVWRIAWQYILGIMMSGFMFMPAVAGYLSSSRTGRAEGGFLDYFMYSADKYRGFIEHFLIPKAWEECLVFPVFILICIVASLMKKQGEKYIKTLLILFCIAYFIPLTGSVMNGFSYSIDRWSYIIYFLMAVLIAETCASGEGFSKKTLILSIGAISGLLILHLFLTEKNIALILRIVAYAGITLMTVILLTNKIKKVKGYNGILAAATLSVCINGIFLNGPVALGGDGYSAGFENNKELFEKIEKSIANGKQDEEGFYRIDAYDASLAGSLVMDFNSATQYFSITNDNTYQFYKQMSISPGIRSALHILKGLDSREVLEAILSVRYYQDMVSDGNRSFSPILVKNESELPFGYLYHRSVSKAEFDELDEFQKMDVLTQSIVIENGSGNVSELEFSNVKRLNSDISYINIEEAGERIKVTPESIIKIRIPSDIYENGELYVKMDDLEFFGDLTTDITVGNKNIQIRRKDDSYYIGTDDFLVHTAVPQNGVLEIGFTEECEIKVGNINVYWYPFNVAKTNLNSLSQNYLENLEIEEDQISGSILADGKAWLFLSIPYSKGWNAWIDGEKTEIQNANVGFMALELSQGMHEIILKYKAPGSRVGLLMSVIGWGIFLAAESWSKKQEIRNWKICRENTRAL